MSAAPYGNQLPPAYQGAPQQVIVQQPQGGGYVVQQVNRIYFTTY